MFCMLDKNGLDWYKNQFFNEVIVSLIYPIVNRFITHGIIILM
jgi:hypothetical protein